MVSTSLPLSIGYCWEDPLWRRPLLSPSPASGETNKGPSDRVKASRGTLFPPDGLASYFLLLLGCIPIDKGKERRRGAAAASHEVQPTTIMLRVCSWKTIYQPSKGAEISFEVRGTATHGSKPARLVLFLWFLGRARCRLRPDPNTKTSRCPI
jgi:hypothetical protein